ncbi:MAG: trigger factor [Candidatus Paceibacterota bacterium]
MKTEIKKLEKSEVEITGTLPVAEFEKYEEKALTRIGDRLELPGFRKGKAPANVIREHATEMMILEEMAELALYDAYPTIIEEHKIDAIGRPQIGITKIAKGADLEFKIITAVLPEMKLPEYKKLASKIISDNPITEIAIDEAEVDKTILEFRKMRAHQAMPKHEHEDNEAHDHPELTEEQLPPLDEAFVKTFGDFATVEAFKEKIRGNMKIEKETAEKDKLRLKIVEELIAKTDGEIPEVLIQGETDKIMYRLQADIANIGFKFEDYIKQIGKTEEALRAEWRADAEKRAKLQMIIHTISEKENLKPTNEEIAGEVEKIMTAYKDADPARAQAYIENMLENEKVFTFLEKQA